MARNLNPSTSGIKRPPEVILEKRVMNVFINNFISFKQIKYLPLIYVRLVGNILVSNHFLLSMCIFYYVFNIVLSH